MSTLVCRGSVRRGDAVSRILIDTFGSSDPPAVICFAKQTGRSAGGEGDEGYIKRKVIAKETIGQ